MEKYAPSVMELAPRDIVSRSIQTEINEGRGFNDEYVHLDLRHLGAQKIIERLPGIREIAIDFAGIDPIHDPIPIQPGQHYSMGGIATDVTGATKVKGLYAAGECACVSVHGANRLGGNSLLDTTVFGKLVAEAIPGYLDNGAGAPDAKILAAELKKQQELIAANLSRTQRQGNGRHYSFRDERDHVQPVRHFPRAENPGEVLRENQGIERALSECGHQQQPPRCAYNPGLMNTPGADGECSRLPK